MTLGFGMNGMEDRILEVTRNVASRFDEITYVEIGVGEGTTLTAIAATLRTSGKKWRAVGIELPNGYSFNRGHTELISAHRGLNLAFANPINIVRPIWGAVTVYFKDSQTLLTEHWQEPLQFALIDGCHGKACVILDFLAIEAFMVGGGVVMFHDFNPEQKGMHQPHCPDGCDVWGAVNELGLMNGKRKGWALSDRIIASREQGGWDMGVFTKEHNNG